MDGRLYVCKICLSCMNPCFEGKALRRYTFEMLYCPCCGFMQIANPFWLEEAYSDVIATCDTGLVARNLALADRLTPIFYYLFGTNGRYVDLAGGTGLFVRLMRDVGYDFCWSDLYCENVHARGFEFVKDMNCRVATFFEVLEHILDPLAFLLNVIEETGAEALFFTTELFSGTPPNPNDWWYYSFDAGQHISFYQSKTLEIISEQLDMRLISHRGIHVFCKRPIFTRLQNYLNYSLIRMFARYKSRRMLNSKTIDDHQHLINLGRVLE